MAVQDRAAAQEDLALPTLAQVLELPAVRVGRPEVVARSRGTTARVRWVQIGDRHDVTRYLHGGELILSTIEAVVTEPAQARGHVRELADIGVSGLVVELGPRAARLPPALVRACERHGMPLVALHREVKFVSITEAVHTLIVSEQHAALQLATRAQERFTTLCADGTDAEQIVHAVAEITGCPVVFENATHQVLTFDPVGLPGDGVLQAWESRSRLADANGGDEHGPEHWVIAPVETRGQLWGRLVLIPPGEPTAAQQMVLERGANTMALVRRLEHRREGTERQPHRSILTDIIERRYDSEHSMRARLAALGVPVLGRSLVAVLLNTGDTPAASERIAAAAVGVESRSLAAPLTERRLGVLISLPPDADRAGVLTRLAARLHERWADVLVAAGSPARTLAELSGSFAEAAQVLDGVHGAAAKAYYEPTDLQLRGLMGVLRDEPRVQSFVELTLGRLLAHDQRTRSELMSTLRAYLDAFGNKSAAAAAVPLGRQTLYHRLAAIERVLDIDLDSAETCTTLHAAIMALDAVRLRA